MFFETLVAVIRPLIVPLIALNFMLLLVFLYYNRNYILNTFCDVNKLTWFLLGMIIVFAFSLRIFISEPMHVVYTDEHASMLAGKMIMNLEHPWEYYSESVGFPFILSTTFSLFGLNNFVAISTNIFFGLLTIFVVFLIINHICRNQKAALIGSLLISLYPWHIAWSNTAKSNVTSLFFVSLTLFLFLLYYSKKKYSLLWLSYVSLAFAVQFRPENYVLIPVFFIGQIIFNPKSLKKTKGFYPISILLLAIANMINVGYYFLNYMGNANVGFSLNNLLLNGANFGWTALSWASPAWLFIIITTIALVYFVFKRPYIGVVLVMFSIAYWIAYFSSWFAKLSGIERFYNTFFLAQAIIIPHIILAFYSKQVRNWVRNLFILLFAMILILSLVSGWGKLQYFGCDKYRLETTLIEEAEEDIPKSCVILAENPEILESTTYLDVRELDRFFENDNFQDSVLENDCVLFFDDVMCELTDRSNYKGNCLRLKSEFELEPKYTYGYNSKYVIFYKLLGPKD